MPVSKPATAAPAKQAPAGEADHSVLSFIPAGMPRSIVEYLVAAIAGAILLFAFFLLAEIAVFLFNRDGGNVLISVVFLPVICIMPIISGAIGTLILEKLRSKPLTLQRGAMVGAAAGLAGALISTVLLLVLNILPQTNIHPFGDWASGLVLIAVFAIIVVIDAILGALGGALVVKFVKDI